MEKFIVSASNEMTGRWSHILARVMLFLLWLEV